MPPKEVVVLRPICSGRLSVPCLVLLSILLVAGAAPAGERLAMSGESDGRDPAEAPQWDGVSLAMTRESDSKALAGTLERNGVKVVFESRVTPNGAESRILSASGEILSEIVVDEAAKIFEYRVGGVTLSGEATAEAAEIALKTFERPEALLAADHLWPALARRGYDPRSRAMAALAANLTGYAPPPARSSSLDTESACMGCCGPGCWGCTGCYTWACLQHDLCVARHGYTHPRCMRILYLAALSAWCCQDLDLGPLC